MEGTNSQHTTVLQRHLASLKLVSRLLGHELHTQGGAKSITMSRDEVQEIQTAIDIFIEEMGRRTGGIGVGLGVETHIVPTRN